MLKFEITNEQLEALDENNESQKALKDLLSRYRDQEFATKEEYLKSNKAVEELKKQIKESESKKTNSITENSNTPSTSNDPILKELAKLNEEILKIKNSSLKSNQEKIIDEIILKNKLNNGAKNVLLEEIQKYQINDPEVQRNFIEGYINNNRQAKLKEFISIEGDNENNKLPPLQNEKTEEEKQKELEQMINKITNSI